MHSISGKYLCVTDRMELMKIVWTVSVESDMCVTDRMQPVKTVCTVLVKSDLDIRQNGISEDSISGK